MFLAGDEFCNTQFGNNNAYCQDNIISWLDWSRKEKYSEMFEFCKYMIKFRNEHPILHGKTLPSGCGFPEVSVHNKRAWNSDTNGDTRTIGVMFAGRNMDNTEDDIIFIALNTFWEDQDIELPGLPLGRKWSIVVNTDYEHEINKDYNQCTRWQGERHVTMGPRSAIVAKVVKR